MNGKSKAWIEKWSRQKNPRMYPDFYVTGYGSDYEWATSYWMATLLEPLGDRFSEGVKLLDYGCGCARLFNFMTGYLKDFTYIGAEPEGGKELDVAKKYFSSDSRATFITCEEAIKSKEVMNPDAVILGSIFTHLLQDTCEKILESLLPIVNKGGIIVFTALFKPQAIAFRPGAHGFDNCYGVSFQKEGWIEELEEKFTCKIENAEMFETGHGVTHEVFRIQ